MSNYGAAGRVGVDFLHPVIARYNNAGGKVTYTDGIVAGRGVKVSLNLDTPSDNDFYADGVVAESENGLFGGGTVALTIDGAHPETDRMMHGLPAPKEVTVGDKTVAVTKFGAAAKPPYLGVGFIRVYQCAGALIYVPIVLTKCKFRSAGLDASTREKTTSWQTQEKTADLHRDDTEDQDWRWVCEDHATAADAIATLHALLNVVDSGQSAEEAN